MNGGEGAAAAVDELGISSGATLGLHSNAGEGDVTMGEAEEILGGFWWVVESGGLRDYGSLCVLRPLRLILKNGDLPLLCHPHTA